MPDMRSQRILSASRPHKDDSRDPDYRQEDNILGKGADVSLGVWENRL